jgi:hypothetical protein
MASRRLVSATRLMTATSESYHIMLFFIPAIEGQENSSIGRFSGWRQNRLRYTSHAALGASSYFTLKP